MTSRAPWARRTLLCGVMGAFLFKKLSAEFIGTFWLVFAGCGSAVFAATFLAGNIVAGQSVQLGIGFLGVALAFITLGVVFLAKQRKDS